MSHLSEYCGYIETARSCLRGRLQTVDFGYGRVGSGPVHFPLPNVMSSEAVRTFYNHQALQVERARLRTERKTLYKRFTRQLITAFEIINFGGEREGTVTELDEPLAHLSEALTLMCTLMDFDNANPISWSELIRRDVDVPRNLPPGENWLRFKLSALRQGLLLLVQILRIILPDCLEFWAECKAIVEREEYMTQFVIDSDESLSRLAADTAPGGRAPV
ncbi:hypothetical protein F5Y15DRAFT_284264 [Xylariaceae sp. FL0016]|nr:hypothetical protein F5Y15DRAFT_284264 [Xylariaceae sp. FL0016]